MQHVDTAIQFIISVLFNGMWEVPLFAFAAGLILRIRPRLNATTRHSVFAAALVAGVVMPIVTASVALKNVSAVAPSASDAQFAQTFLPYRPLKAQPSGPRRTRDDGTPLPSSLPIPSVPHANLSLPRLVVLTIVALWLTTTAILLSRLVVSLLHLERLKRDALPLSVEYRAQLSRWSAATRVARKVRLCRSSQTVVPVAVGLGDALILVPDHFLKQFEPHDIDAIILHELAHLRRGDDWLHAFERVAAALLFFNPGILWLIGKLDLEREVACDDWVLQSSEALPYATLLSKVVETTSWPYRAVTTPGAFITRRGMSIRIERLLVRQRDVGVHTALAPAGAIVAVLAVCGIAALSASPSIAYTAVIEPPRIAPSPPSVVARSPQSALPRRTTPPISGVAVQPVPQSARPLALPITGAIAKVAVRAQSFAPLAARQLATEIMHAVGNPQLVATANEPGYIDELASAGYEHLSVDELIQMKAVGVTAAFIRGLQREGLSHLPIGELIEMRALGVDVAFVRTLRRRYGNSLSVDDIAGMKAVGVSAAYVDELSADGQPNLTARETLNLRALDVTPAFIHDLAGAGYPNLTVEEIEQLKALGIDAAYIARAAAHGFHHPSIEQLVKLKATGVL